jgi:hypothetical protein
VIVFSGSCTQSIQWQSASGSRGETLRWRPARPQIGDLVTFEAVVPVVLTGNAPADIRIGLAGADGNLLIPSRTEYVSAGKKFLWSFRITRPGEWSWVVTDKTKILWSVASIAGKATELIKIDAQKLLSGKVSRTGNPEKAAP